MRKKITAWLIIVAAMALVYSVIVSYPTKYNLSRLIESRSQEINLASTTYFPWDEVLIFTPYITRDKVNKELGFRFILENSSDRNVLMVFTLKSFLTGWLYVPRRHWDFDQIPTEGNYRVQRTNAVFIVDYRGEEFHPYLRIKD